MHRDATVDEQRRLAGEVIEMLDSVGDSTNLTGNELAQFDLRRNEILEEMAPVARRLAELVFTTGTSQRQERH